MSFFIICIVIAIGCFVLAALISPFTKTNPSVRIDRKRFPKSGIWPLEDIPHLLLISDSDVHTLVRMTVFRQSGNIERVEDFDSPSQALKAAGTVFRRMKELDVRIWKNEQKIADYRRPYYSGRGVNEGKKLWGIRLEVIG